MTEIQTETQLRAVIDGEKLSVVCFHSSRSAYSRRTVQTLAAAESELPGVDFCLVDADADALLPLLLEFSVVGLPTILIFRAGLEAKRLIGDRNEKVFLGFLQKLTQ